MFHFYMGVCVWVWYVYSVLCLVSDNNYVSYFSKMCNYKYVLYYFIRLNLFRARRDIITFFVKMKMFVIRSVEGSFNQNASKCVCLCATKDKLNKYGKLTL